METTACQIHLIPKSIVRVVKASRKPLSIIIIGVGDADFSDMDVLDSDSVTLRSGKIEADVRYPQSFLI